MIDYQLAAMISRCMPVEQKLLASKPQNFPLDTAVYMLMKSAKINDLYGGTLGLNRLYEEYAAGRDLLFNIQELIDKGWIQAGFGEWQPALSFCNKGNFDEIIDDKLSDVMKFMVFARENRIENPRIAIVANPENILKELRTSFLQIPEADWFVNNHILNKHDDVYAFWQGYNHVGHINRAAASLWAFDIKHDDDDDKFRWLKLVCACYASDNLIEYLDYNSSGTLLEWKMNNLGI